MRNDKGLRPPSEVGLHFTICRHPPLHPRQDGLSDFEFTVLATLLSLVWDEHCAKARIAGGRAGAREIARRKAAGDEGRKLKHAASDAHWKKRNEALREIPDRMTLTITPTGLLSKAKISSNGTNLNRVKAAFERLHDPVVIDGEKWSGLIVKNYNGCLTLNTRTWISDKNFVYIPLPLPNNSHGARILALYLLVNMIDFSKTGRMTLSEICTTLGIHSRWPAEARRSIKRAVGEVSEHLKWMYDSECIYVKHEIKVRFDGDNVLLSDCVEGKRAQKLQQHSEKVMEYDDC